MELQPRLFTDLPPTREETPVHQLNYPTFAGAENTMWHGRDMGKYREVAEDMWEGDFGPQDYGWEPNRVDPVHVGTFEAAAHRALPYRQARQPVRNPGDVSTTYDAGYRPRTEIMEVAGTGKDAQLLPFRIREGSMRNEPGMPVSDAYANLAEGRYGDGYEDTYADELMLSGVLSEEESDDLMNSIGPSGDFGDYYPEPLSEGGGVYYSNQIEDGGSISAVVPTARDLQHWPTEVMKHSTNPAQRRTAEFLLGRGY